MIGSEQGYHGGGCLRKVFDVVCVLQMCCVSFAASSKALVELASPFMFCPTLSASVFGHSSR